MESASIYKGVRGCGGAITGTTGVKTEPTLDGLFPESCGERHTK